MFSVDVYCLSFSFQMIQDMKQQFAGLLYEIGFLESSYTKAPAANYNSGFLYYYLSPCMPVLSDNRFFARNHGSCLLFICVNSLSEPQEERKHSEGVRTSIVIDLFFRFCLRIHQSSFH